MKVVVKSALAETDLDASPKSLFKDIFLMICKSLGLTEIWYFGLNYKGTDTTIWLDSSNKAIKQLTAAVKDLQFQIKYYPENIGDELLENITVQLFYTEIKTAILTSKIFCPADTSALLASYSLQVKYGDYSESKHNEDFFTQQNLLPARVIKQHDLDVVTWTESIVNMWKKLSGLDSEEAMLEYLKLAQNLDMFGVTYFKIKNKRGTNLLLGLSALGLDIYKPDDQLNPQVSFPWSEIKHLTFRDKKFIIKPLDRKAPDFIFFTTSGRMNKQILKLGIGNHKLYVRRRKPDPPEIITLREKCSAVREMRKKHKDKLYSEKYAREESERREQDYLDQLRRMREEYEQSKNNLLEANKIIEQLQVQLASVQKANAELEKERIQLQEMTERLQHMKNLEESERLQLENQIKEKMELVEKMQNEVNDKDVETRKLHQQVEEERKKEEEFRKQQILAEEERLKKLKEEENNMKEELESVPENNNKALPEIAEVNDQLKEQLKALQEKLEETRKQEEDTQLDKIHRVNLVAGKDKYKTLADIRRGNTHRRIEMFENM